MNMDEIGAYLQTIAENSNLEEVWLIDDEFGEELDPSDSIAALEPLDDGRIQCFADGVGFEEGNTEGGIDERALVEYCVETDQTEKLESFLGMGGGGALAFEKAWNMLDGPCDVEKLPPQKARRQIEAGLQDCPRLIVSDLNLSKSNLGNHGGARLLGLALTQTDQSFGVLVSQEFNGGPEVAREEMRNVTESVDFPKKDVVPIPKQILLRSEGEPRVETVLLLLSGLMARQRDELLRQVEKTLQTLSGEILDNIWELAPHEFAQAVVWSTEVEGTNYTQRTARLVENEFRRLLHEELSEPALEESFGQLTDWKPPTEDGFPETVFPGVSDLHARELLDSKEWLTATTARVSLGDIYSVGEAEDVYVLLEQPCDLALRRDGERACHMAKMAEVRTVAQDEKSREDGRYFEMKGIREVGPIKASEGQSIVIDFGEMKRIDPLILDLTVVGEGVEASIDLGGDVSTLDEALNERLRKIRGALKEIQGRDGENLPDFFAPVKRGTIADRRILCPGAEIDGSILTFDLQREARLRTRWGQAALSNWARYRTRDAFPGSYKRGLSRET